ncbi:unnamed protein product [Cyclocybe aegerita]|uniref:F-box domain-containing protein n=1 Tax=Cyclocybe aegerita TaxID=1973307 RepID=A0A8S0XII2_CYCAE|nr:unnamed protein product [Cyclocybe aegerita]
MPKDTTATSNAPLTQDRRYNTRPRKAATGTSTATTKSTRPAKKSTNSRVARPTSRSNASVEVQESREEFRGRIEVSGAAAGELTGTCNPDVASASSSANAVKLNPVTLPVLSTVQVHAQASTATTGPPEAAPQISLIKKTNSDTTIQKNKAPFLSNRLALIVSPATKKATPKVVKESAIPMILKNFVGLPLDIILEICSYIDPMDLLNLTRVSKLFREFFMSRATLSIWRKVLEQEGLPKCPEDMSDPQYASLMFDEFCMACLSTRGTVKPDYKLRLRLCVGCAKANVANGYGLMYRFGQSAKSVFTLLPSSFVSRDGFEWPIKPPSTAFSSAENNEGTHYIIPEAALMLDKYDELSRSEYASFATEHQARATRMMNEGHALHHWDILRQGRKEKAKEDMEDVRRYLMLEEMKRLGWEEKYFPDDSDDSDTEKWDKYLNQKKEFTLRSWKALKPKLEQIYKKSKRGIMFNAIARRFEDAYLEFRKNESDLLKRVALPPLSEVQALCPSLAPFLIKNEWEPRSDEDIHNFMSTVAKETQGFLPNARKDLVALLRRGGAITGSELDEMVLGRASALFFCRCRKCHEKNRAGTQLFAYPEVVDHWVSANSDKAKWEVAKIDIFAKGDVIQAAKDVLVALGLEKGCRRDEMEKLGKLACRCGCVHNCGPLTFERLVYHVYRKREEYATMRQRVLDDAQTKAEALLLNSHAAERLPSFVVRAGKAVDEARAQVNANPPSKKKSELSIKYIGAWMENIGPSLERLFVADRLRLIIPPEFEKPLHLLVPAQGFLAKRRIGALKLFLDLPLDVIFEAISYLSPADVLTLTRVSREFRSLFLSRSSSLAIWRRVVVQVPGLPPCPEDLDEPQYASLVYDKFCMACGSTRGVLTTYYRLRLRFCTKCAKRNLMDGYDIRSEGYAYSDTTLFLEILPSSGIDYEGHDPNNRDQKVSTLNDLEALYFKPEVEDIIGHVMEIIQAMGDNPNFEEIFSLIVGDQISVASRMIQEGILLEQWQADQNDAAATEKEALTTTRYERIMQEIAALGWEEYYFPTEYSPGTQEDLEQWMKFLFQAKEFTVRGWKAIRPKMEAIYLRSKELIRINTLLDLIQDEFLACRSRLPVERRRQTPGWQDTLDDPRLDIFIEQTHATNWTSDNICTFVDALLADTADFFSRVQAEVVDKVVKFYAMPPHPSVLKEARMLFRCQRHECAGMRTYIPFRDVVDHLVETHPEEGWFQASDFMKPNIDATCSRLQAMSSAPSASQRILPTKRSSVWASSKPMTFEKLVFHVYSEQQWCKQKLQQVHPSRLHRVNDLLEDSHNLQSLRDFLDSVPGAGESEEPSTDGAEDTFLLPQQHRCQWCFSLTRRVHLSQIEHETIDFHMKAR